MFWSKVEKRGNGECWNWTASTSRGFGQLGYNGAHWWAHRLAYALSHGTPPPRTPIMHTCGNKLCCNPAHLRVGSMTEISKLTTKRGDWPHAKLTREQVREIRSARAPVGTIIGKDYGVSGETISRIMSGKAHHDESYVPKPLLQHKRERAARVRALREDGHSLAQIAATVGLSESMVCLIVNGKRCVDPIPTP